MVITDFLQISLSYIYKRITKQKSACRVSIGSDFHEDLKHSNVYEIIEQLIFSIELGESVIIVNQDAIYQSFYDFLN